MSARKRVPSPSSRKPVLRAEVPALAAFLAGYLHQDLLAEHGSPEAALRAFMEVATSTERQALAADWHTFHSTTVAWPLTALRRALSDLGSAWIPPTRSRLDTLFAEVSRPD